MININTLIDEHPDWEIIGWTITEDRISLFVIDTSKPLLNMPKTIDGKPVVIYQSN